MRQRSMDGVREYRRAAWIYRTVLQLFCCQFTFELSPAVSSLWNEKTELSGKKTFQCRQWEAMCDVAHTLLGI